jgi:glyoxylase-like metal-dependent hydrolase (beta-lactamase superfamily II)
MSPETFAARYSNVSDDEVTSALDDLPDMPLRSEMNTLYVDNGTSRLLVDTGLGYNRQPQFGNLTSHLQSMGVEPESIDAVFLSHYHGDHIAGLINADGELVFSNARYITHKKEWAHWMSDNTLASMEDDRALYLQSLLNPLQTRLVMVEAGHAIIDGVTVIEAFGHTPGHSGLRVQSGDDVLLFPVDILHHPVQIAHPEWHIKFDADPDQAEATRRAWLREAAESGVLTLFYHLPFPALGTIATDDSGFQWQPLHTDDSAS